MGTALVVIMLTLYPSHIEANYSHGSKNCFGLNMQVSSPKCQDSHSLGKERMSAIELSAEITLELNNYMNLFHFFKISI